MRRHPEWVDSFYATIDRMDAEGFAEFFTEDASFRFANQDPVVGRGAIAGFGTAIFSSLRAIAHEIHVVWEVPGALVNEGHVTYTRPDGKQIRLPFMTVSEMRGPKIENYRVYIDSAPLYAP